MIELDTLIVKGGKSIPLFSLFGVLRAAGYTIKATAPGEVTAIPPAQRPAPVRPTTPEAA